MHENTGARVVDCLMLEFGAPYLSTRGSRGISSWLLIFYRQRDGMKDIKMGRLKIIVIDEMSRFIIKRHGIEF